MDIGYILTEAIVNVVPTTYYKPARQQIVSTDYFQLLSDILSDEEELAHNLDDILTQAADLCFRVHNFFVIGFSAQLEQDERNYLSSVVYPQDDYEMHTKAVELTEDAIILGCGIPKVFDEDEDGGKWIPSDRYYGELTFKVSYKDEKEEAFPWLYLDYNTLQNACFDNGLQCELIVEGEHFDYLAKLTK